MDKPVNDARIPMKVRDAPRSLAYRGKVGKTMELHASAQKMMMQSAVMSLRVQTKTRTELHYTI